MGHAGNQEGLYGGLVEDVNPASTNNGTFCSNEGLSGIPGYLASVYPTDGSCPTGAAAAHCALFCRSANSFQT